MEAGLIIGNQIIIMFIILIVGAFCYLKGIITKDGTKQLSSFALNIINPVLIFMSYQSKYDKSLVHGLLWSFLLSAISYAVTILLTYVLIRKKTPDLAVERVSSIYSNCAFMCIPLINGIYGIYHDGDDAGEKTSPGREVTGDNCSSGRYRNLRRIF